MDVNYLMIYFCKVNKIVMLFYKNIQYFWKLIYAKMWRNEAKMWFFFFLERCKLFVLINQMQVLFWIYRLLVHLWVRVHLCIMLNIKLCICHLNVSGVCFPFQWTWCSVRFERCTEIILKGLSQLVMVSFFLPVPEFIRFCLSSLSQSFIQHHSFNTDGHLYCLLWYKCLKSTENIILQKHLHPTLK